MDERREAALGICRRLAGAGHRALLAGGCVRDVLLGVAPRDYDIATSAKPEEVEGLFDRCIGVGAAFGVEVVVLPEGRFEVATFRRDGPYLDGRRPSHVEFVDEEEDAARRDFTINALFFDPATEEVLDYVGGRRDLDAGLVRAVGVPGERFREDHLRLIRAVRFAARLDYAIETATEKAIREHAPLILKTSPERVRDEILKILTEGRPRRGFELLETTGLLEAILPEVARMKGVAQPEAYHPEGDVFTHTLILLECLDRPSDTLALAALLHDVGKPLTQTYEDRIRFDLHDKVGARETEKICRRFRMSKEQSVRASWLVGQHMRVAAAPKMRDSKLKRLVRHEGFGELLALFRADCVASHNKLEVHDWLRDYTERLEPESIRPAPLLTGKDLLAMGYEAGPLFSTILRAVEDAQLEGRLTDDEAALEFVRSRWPGAGGEGRR